MILTERHNIIGNNEIIRLCKISKELYNKVNYLIRQRYFNNIPIYSLSELYQLLKKDELFLSLHNTKTATQLLIQLLNDWSNYFKLLKAYKKDSSKFLGYPKPPGYKKKMNCLTFYNPTIRRKPLKDNQFIPTNNLFQIKSNHINDYKQVKVIPKSFGFIVEITYEKNVQSTVKTENICCIDLGVNNLCSITSNKNTPILINGRILKSINQYYNKKKTIVTRKDDSFKYKDSMMNTIKKLEKDLSLQEVENIIKYYEDNSISLSNNQKQLLKKRYYRIENYFHHVSKWIINYCIKYKITTIIIGKNDGWKQESNLKTKDNQNFQHIPFDNLLMKIKYKAELVGITVKFTEESYTSKSSFLNRDHLPKYRNSNIPEFSGYRPSGNRGIYKIKNSTRVIHSDINGSLNIGRKVIGDKMYDIFSNRSIDAMPLLINPLREINK